MNWESQDFQYDCLQKRTTQGSENLVDIRGPLTHDSGVPPITFQHNFIVQPLVTKEWNARTF